MLRVKKAKLIWLQNTNNQPVEDFTNIGAIPIETSRKIILIHESES